jgi:hypothetical protein
MMANKQQRSPSTHIASAIAAKIEIKQGKPFGADRATCDVSLRWLRKVQKPMCRQPLATEGASERQFALSCPTGRLAVTVRVLANLRILCPSHFGFFGSSAGPENL